MGKIIMGIVFIIGGLSGTLVLRGTNSGEGLAGVGAVFLIWGIIQMASGGSNAEEDVEIKPIVDENILIINQIVLNKEGLNPSEVANKLNTFIDNILQNISKLDDYYKVVRTLKEVQKNNLIPEEESLKRNNEIDIILKKLQFEEIVNKKSKPLIDALILEKTNGTISESEFIEKQLIIDKNTRFEIEEDIRTKPTLSDIDDKIKEKLTGVKLHKVENNLKVMQKGEVIALYNNNFIKLLTKEAWKAILESNTSDKYEKIFERV